MSAPITAEAKGKLRQLKQRLTKHAAAIDRTMPALLEQAEELLNRQSIKGRARVFDRLQTKLAKHGCRLEQCSLEGNAPLALWSYLKPRCAVTENAEPETGADQECITLDYVLVGSVEGPGSACTADGLWTAEFSDHALHRLLTRCPGADLQAVMFACHDALLALPMSVLKQTSDALLISAGDGVFIAELRFGLDVSDYRPAFHFRAKTWVHHDQLRPDQVPEPKVSGEQAIGCYTLRPKPLREFFQQDGGDEWKVAIPKFTVGFDIRPAVNAATVN